MNILIDICKWDGFWAHRGSDAMGIKLGWIGFFIIFGDLINTNHYLQEKNAMLTNIIDLMEQRNKLEIEQRQSLEAKLNDRN